MKKIISYFLIVMLIPAFVLTGCKDEKVEQGTFTDLSSYMIANGYDLPALLVGWVIDPKLTTEDGGIVDPTDYSIPGWTVFDIRSAESFDEAHIKGSVNVALKDVVTTANAINDNTTKILVVCYTGQTAGRAVMALRLSGFPNAKVSKFGFSAWSDNSDFDSWSSVTNDGNIADGNSNWVTTSSQDLPTNGIDPGWNTTATDGEAILNERVAEMLVKSGWGVNSVDVLDAPLNYSIYNFWTSEDYLLFGHFTDAFQYKPISFENLSAMNPENNNIIYCYTGQTSSFIVAWLQVLGYNSQSVKFGVNSLKYTELSDATPPRPHWHFPYHSYEYETTK